jgi:hypothetical protein
MEYTYERIFGHTDYVIMRDNILIERVKTEQEAIERVRELEAESSTTKH